MARYRKIDVRMWGDEKFRRLTPPPPCGQSLWIYMLTGPHTTNVPGLSSIGEFALAEAIGWPLEGLRKAFAEAFGEGLLSADFRSKFVWIPNAIRYNKPASINVVKSWRSTWDEAPECQLKLKAWQDLKAFLEGMGKGFAEAFEKSCPKPSLKAMANQEQEQDQEQDGMPDEPKSTPVLEHGLTNSNPFDPVSTEPHWPIRRELARPVDLSPKSEPDPRVRKVVEAYLQEWPKRQAQAQHPDTLTVIRARLADGYELDDLKLAILGNKRSKYHADRNLHDLRCILESAERVDRFVAEAQGKVNGGGPAPSAFYAAKQREAEEKRRRAEAEAAEEAAKTPEQLEAERLEAEKARQAFHAAQKTSEITANDDDLPF